MCMRFIVPEVVAALGDTSIVLVIGARQTGKSTLVQHLTKKHRGDDGRHHRCCTDEKPVGLRIGQLEVGPNLL